MELIKDFQIRPLGLSEADAVAQAIAELGEEGWELVAAGGSHDGGAGVTRSFGFNTIHTYALYFKRSGGDTGT